MASIVVRHLAALPLQGSLFDAKRIVSLEFLFSSLIWVASEVFGLVPTFKNMQFVCAWCS